MRTLAVQADGVTDGRASRTRGRVGATGSRPPNVRSPAIALQKDSRLDRSISLSINSPLYIPLQPNPLTEQIQTMKHITFAAAAVLMFALGACTQVDQHADRPASSTPASSTPGASVPTTPTTTPAAVGAPQVTTAPTATAPTTAAPTTGAPTAAPSIAPATPTQKVGLNPPHGQPGHSCAIPVGAPLSSIPAAGASTPPAPTVSMQTTPQAPAPQAPINMSAGNAGASGSKRINPAHGQPGHTCSVPVGQPIP
jgi:hypothetical protein